MKSVPVVGKSINANAYDRLIKDLRTIWETGKTRARRAIAKEALRAYWEMGGRIAQEQLTENAGYARSVMQRLAKDIKTDMTTLYRCVQFHETYKAVPETEVLAWAHYRVLLTIKDLKEREYYTVQAENNEWTRDQLLRAVQGDRYGEGKKGKKAKQLPRRCGLRFRDQKEGEDPPGWNRLPGDQHRGRPRSRRIRPKPTVTRPLRDAPHHQGGHQRPLPWPHFLFAG
ncbi:MAG: hypothetical protein IPN19_12625 [Elusimicrobia bacterium]|nr:hypothetical protein [Elusimicrobiota bacterium]